ncbi:MAG: MBL fold metallo-hydrolase [bacterium]|nr:MBL fold metallo-hydrolase [bacterium]
MKRLLVWTLALPLALSAADTLDIYWIDVEGGASTLIVTPAGETVLMDAGYAGFGDRDAKRIHHVLTAEAKAGKIDYFLASHSHGDHIGGLGALAKLVSIDHFIDHGDSVDKDRDSGRPRWENYLKVAGGKRQVVKPGDKLPLREVDLTIVASHSKFIDAPLAGDGANPYCKDFEPKPEDKGENGKSLGYLLRAGDFEFVNLGDLSWNYQYQMACPVNLLGEVDLYQVTHHGVRDDAVPQQVWALKPTVAVMNNGPRKGAGPKAYEYVAASPGLADLWQLHRAVGNDDAHNTDEKRTANLGPTEGCAGNWIKASLASDGTYSITNSRNGHSRSYRVK